MSNHHVEYIEADAAMKLRIAAEWGELPARHVHVDGGFTIVALAGTQPVGLLSVAWRELTPPIGDSTEAFIDLIEVREEFRRRSIARRMIGMAAARAKERGASQLRAWSSADKHAAIFMWQTLGFGLCPAVVQAGGADVRGYFAALPV